MTRTRWALFCLIAAGTNTTCLMRCACAKLARGSSVCHSYNILPVAFSFSFFKMLATGTLLWTVACPILATLTGLQGASLNLCSHFSQSCHPHPPNIQSTSSKPLTLNFGTVNPFQLPTMHPTVQHLPAPASTSFCLLCPSHGPTTPCPGSYSMLCSITCKYSATPENALEMFPRFSRFIL